MVGIGVNVVSGPGNDSSPKRLSDKGRLLAIIALNFLYFFAASSISLSFILILSIYMESLLRFSFNNFKL